MRKLLNKPWFVAVMAVAALALVAHVVFSDGDKFGLKKLVGSGSDPVENIVSTADETQTTAWSAVKRIQVPLSGRDPFAVKVKAIEVVEKAPEPDAVDTVHLSAIWTQEGHTFAVINDRICQNGDEIGRLKIESATQEGVWLSHWKGRDFISIGGNFTLNTPAGKALRAAITL